MDTARNAGRVKNKESLMTACHTTLDMKGSSAGRIALVGQPNVGKSMLFHRLTGQYVIVSNYPGTTVEVSTGRILGLPDVALIDTPGILALPPRTEDERVTTRVLLTETLRAVLLVGDAKNLRRTLRLAIQVAEMNLPMVLALNMSDEAESLGLNINALHLSDMLGIPVVPTVAINGKGVKSAVHQLEKAPVSTVSIHYDQFVEEAILQLEFVLPNASIAKRSMALLWLCEDNCLNSWLTDQMTPADLSKMKEIRAIAVEQYDTPLNKLIFRRREELVLSLEAHVLEDRSGGKESIQAFLSRISTHPLLGLPVLAIILYAMYWFVGVFGAGMLVGLLEKNLFGQIINPWFTHLVRSAIPVPFISGLLVGDYGLWTMGMTYALALLLPIVLTFFLMFGFLEDSGYLPRLSILTNRLFSLMGLNGHAVLPMVLGLGCVTMATMTTRIMTSRRDRLLVTFLLALAIPCSAQLGVVMGMLAGISLGAASIWGGIIFAVLVLVGWLSARLLPGERTPLVVELPPLRMPVLTNVLIKTAARLEWYIKEAIPLFLLGTVLLFVLDQVKVLPWLIDGLKPLVVDWLGLPAEAASAFLLGLMRRDFAATGLFHMEAHGLLSPLQVVVSMVTITLFIPCIASIFMIGKERGWKTAAGMSLFIFPFALLIGGLLNRILLFLNWTG
jgi:ferrous iron transport protein B